MIQVIVNGRVDGVGNSPKGLQSLITQGSEVASSAVNVEVTDGGITVVGREGAKGVVTLVRYDTNTVDVSIKHGENGGRNIPHRNIVYEVTSLGTWHGGSQAFSLPRSREGNLKEAILVSTSQGGPVIGAARL